MKSEKCAADEPTPLVDRERTGPDELAHGLEEFLEQANALIVGVDRHGKVRLCSTVFLGLVGCVKEGVLGTDLEEFFPESERTRVAQALASALDGERRASFDSRIIAARGRQARVSLATSPVLGVGGRPVGMLAIGQDLTATPLLEQRLLHTEKLASLGRFAASVAHEINNPLTAIVGCTESLLACSAGAEAPDGEKLRKILDGCERILRLTRQLVSYARPPDERPERLQLQKVLDTALSYCDHVLSHHAIAVVKEYHAVPEVTGIQANLAQVFVNLITNACQAMQAGGTLRIATERDRQHALVRFSDNGAGMDSQILPRVFEPFFTTKPDGMGSGLGLCIARSIVESHGGEIEVRSSVGQGTTFVIRLPGSAAESAIAESLTFDDSHPQSATI